jgi:cysteine desulfurase
VPGGYFDHNATTPLEVRVRDAMLPWLGERWGNASSAHAFGRAAREAVEEARDRVAALLGARPADVVFCGSGTEANNAVVAGAARRGEGRGRIVLSAFEHPSVDGMAARLAGDGTEVVRVEPGPDGVVDPGAMADALTEETLLACLMLANNEIGTVQPVAAVAGECRRRGVPLLCDAVQGAGKMPVAVEDLGADYVVIGAHKFYGPVGAAALWLRPGAAFEPYLVGGSQERRRRASTVNVAGVVGLGAAAALARAEGASWAAHAAAVRDRFEAGLAAIPDVVVHGVAAPRIPNTSHVAFLGIENEALMVRLDLEGFAVSTGSACHSGIVEPSQAMRAMRVPDEEAIASLRVSFGKGNTVAEVDAFLGVLEREVAALRELAASPA